MMTGIAVRAWLVAAALVLVAASAARAEVFVTVHDGRVSVDAHGVAVREVVTEVARLTGTRITIEDGVGGAVTSVSFRSLPVDEAFRRILRAHGVGLIYSASDLVEVRVYRDPAGAAAAPVAGASIGTVTEAPRPASAAPSDELARLRREALEHPDPAARSAAVDRLSETRNNAFVVETALAVLERDRETGVLLSALDLLTGRESVPLDPVLRHMMAWPPAVRLQVLEILSAHRHRDPRVESALQAAASADPDEAVRTSARALLRHSEP